jgi:acyl carrier protein
VFDRLRQIAADIFQLSPEQITPLSSPENIQTWNSVRFLSLILAVEEEFGLMFEPQDLERITTLGEFATLIETKLAGIV